jgi:hypothetical protein
MNALKDLAAELPDGPFWVTGKWMKKLIHILAADRVRAGTGVDEYPTEAGRFFSAQAGTTEEETDTPWQAYLSPWQGTGTDPNLATRKARFRLQRGKFSSATPSNMSTEFLAFGDITDTGIEEDDAVYTQVYLTVPVSESSLGSGDVTYGTPEIDTVEGNDLVAALSGSVPAFGTDGSLPSAIIVPICEIQMYGGAIHFPPGESTYLAATLSVSGGSDCEHQMRAFTVVQS